MKIGLDTDWTLEGLDNPQLIQHRLLNRFEKDTGVAIVDTNNPACVIMEGFAEMTSNAMKMIDNNVRPAIYPSRAVWTSDLFKHISDYDYVNMISSPASTTITMIVDKNYVIAHSLPVPQTDEDGNEVKDSEGNTIFLPYKKMVIPRSSTVTIGEHTFGIFYPIELRVIESANKFYVVYDTSVYNPLKNLETNVLEFDFREFNGHHLAYIQIPVYQFDIAKHDIVLVAGSGWKNTIEYTDKFYAIRCTAEVLQNYGHDDTEEDVFKRQELELRIAGQTYDPKSPTVIFTPDEENNECLLEIPYVYFTEGRLRGTMRVELYTTKGYLNYNVPTDVAELCTIDMFSRIETADEEKYASPFRFMPALNCIPTSMEIVGGSNGLTFNELRRLVIKGVNTTVLQTPEDIDAYFAGLGYLATLYRDGITDRIFIVHTTVRDTDDEIIACDTIPTLFDFRQAGDISTLVCPDEGGTTYTVLPSTLYKFDQDARICHPLTDVERKKIDDLKNADKVELFNQNIFTLSPFHLQIDAAKRYPTTVTYDMKDKEIHSRTFVASIMDQNIPYELTLNTLTFDVVKGNLKDTYELEFKIGRVNFPDGVTAIAQHASIIDYKNIRVLVGLKNDDGRFYYAEAQWIKYENDYDIFKLTISPTYVFHQANNDHTVQMGFWNSNAQVSDFYLTSEARIMLLVKKDIGTMIDFIHNPLDDLPQYLVTDWTNSTFISPSGEVVSPGDAAGLSNCWALTEYKAVLRFGSVVDEVDQRINLTYGEAEYKRHLTTSFRTLEADQYARDKDKNLIVDVTKPKGEMVQIEYEQDTLRCMTVQQEESIVPNEFTASNYAPRYADEAKGIFLGCHVVEGSETVELTKEKLDAAVEEGKELFISDAPIPPRFIISDTSDDHENAKGEYELKDALNKKFSLSSCHDVWAKTGDLRVDKSDPKRNMIVKTVNALKFVLDPASNVTVFEEADTSKGDDPLDHLTYDYAVGTFLFLKNDVEERSQVQLGTFGEIDPKRTRGYGRLFYKFRELTNAEVKEGALESSTWYCIVTAQDEFNAEGEPVEGHTAYDKIWSTIVEDDSDPNAPKFYGFAYLMSLKEVGGDTKYQYFGPSTTINFNGFTLPDFHRIVQTAWENRESYVVTKDVTAKLNKRYFYHLLSTTEDRYVELTVAVDDPLKIPEGVTTLDDKIYFLQSVTIVEDEFGWESHDNRWPWEVKQWNEINETVITKAGEVKLRYNAVVKASTFEIKLDLNRLNRYCNFTSNKLILTEDGHPIEDPTRQRALQYLVDMFQMDAKHNEVTTNTDFPESVVKILRTHYDNVGRSRDTMFTNTRLFFEPVRSLGFGMFNVGNNIVKELPLDVTMAFRFHVTQSTYEDEALLDSLRKRLIQIIDEHIEKGYVNCAEIASAVISELNDSVKYVDVLGINGDPDLQTMKCVDPEVRAHLKHRLVNMDDNATIDVDRAVDLEFVVND